MTTWNLRVLEVPDGANSYYEIREVFYNDKGEPFGHSRATMRCESQEALRTYLTWAIEALDKPTFQTVDLVANNADYPDFH